MEYCKNKVWLGLSQMTQVIFFSDQTQTRKGKFLSPKLSSRDQSELSCPEAYDLTSIVVWFYGTHFLYLSPTFSVRDKIYFGPKKCLSKSTWQCHSDGNWFFFRAKKKEKERSMSLVLLDNLVECQKLKRNPQIHVYILTIFRPK